MHTMNGGLDQFDADENQSLGPVAPCDDGPSEPPAHEGEVVRHRYEDKRLCGLDNLRNGVHVPSAIFGAEKFGGCLQGEGTAQTPGKTNCHTAQTLPLALC